MHLIFVKHTSIISFISIISKTKKRAAFAIPAFLQRRGLLPGYMNSLNISLCLRLKGEPQVRPEISLCPTTQYMMPVYLCIILPSSL